MMVALEELKSKEITGHDLGLMKKLIDFEAVWDFDTVILRHQMY